MRFFLEGEQVCQMPNAWCKPVIRLRGNGGNRIHGGSGLKSTARSFYLTYHIQFPNHVDVVDVIYFDGYSYEWANAWLP